MKQFKLYLDVSQTHHQPPAVNVYPKKNHREKPTKINFLGDSITYGTSLRAGEKPYPVLLSDMIHLDVANYGISGSCLATVTRPGGCLPFTKRFDSMRNDAEIIFVFGGTNDYGMEDRPIFGSISDNQDISFLGGLRTLMAGLIEKYPNRQIVFSTPIKRLRPPAPHQSKTLESYSNAILEMGASYSIPVIDAYHAKDVDFTQSSSLLNPDGLHPTQEGQQKLAEFFYAQLIKKNVIRLSP